MQYIATKFHCDVDMSGSPDLSHMLKVMARQINGGSLGGPVTDQTGQAVGEWRIAVERVDESHRVRADADVDARD